MCWCAHCSFSPLVSIPPDVDLVMDAGFWEAFLALLHLDFLKNINMMEVLTLTFISIDYIYTYTRCLWAALWAALRAALLAGKARQRRVHKHACAFEQAQRGMFAGVCAQMLILRCAFAGTHAQLQFGVSYASIISITLNLDIITGLGFCGGHF